MEQLGYTVAVEISSNEISGIIGKKLRDGSIQIMSYASEPSSSFIKKGMVFNIDKAASAMTSIINRLEGGDFAISKVYVGLSGRSMRTVSNMLLRKFDGEVKITQSILDDMGDENLKTDYNNNEILYPIPQEYKLENDLVVDPKGVLTNSIEGRYVNLIASAVLKRRLQDCMDNAKVDVAEFLVSPLCLGNQVLSGTERHSGCALVDFGAGTTTVSIYKGNILRYLVVLPLGGHNITRDLAELLKIEEAEAEDLKLKYGVVVNYDEEQNETDDKILIQSTGNMVDKSYFYNIITARAEEIVKNVCNVIQQSGYEEQLVSGILAIGGAANMTGLIDLLERTCKKMKVRKVRRSWALNAEDCTTNVDPDSISDTLLALLAEGKETCCDRNTLKEGNNLFDLPKHDEEEQKESGADEHSGQSPEIETTTKPDRKERKKTNQAKGESKQKNGIFGSLFDKFDKLLGEDSNFED